MAKDEGPGSFKAFDDRLERFRRRDGAAAKSGSEHAPGLNWGSGLQVGVELVAGLIGGCLLGWVLDRWLATSPLFLIVFFLLGAAAGMLNAMRHLRRTQGGGGERGG